VLAGSAVIISSPFSKTIRAFDAATGRIRWKRDLEAMHKGAVTVNGDDVLFGDRNGDMSFLSLASGATTGTCTAGSPFTVFAPILVGRTLFVATKNGAVIAAPYDSVRARATRRAPCY
jgi:outer membrane protein assembly factor BamB